MCPSDSAPTPEGHNPPTHSSVATSLLVRACQRDSLAWQQLDTLFRPLVLEWCRRAGLQAADAADIAQQVWTAVAGSLGDFRRSGSQDSFRGWLWTITQNKLRDRGRRQGRIPVAPGGSEFQRRAADEPAPISLDTSAVFTPDERQLLLERAVALVRAEFEPRTWLAFAETTISERPAAEVGAELEMSVGAVYVAKSRVLRRLREELAGLVQL